MKLKELNPLHLLYFLTCITGLGYYLIAIKTSEPMFWEYRLELINSAGIMPKIINYGKDIMVFLWAVKSFFEAIMYNRVKKRSIYVISGITWWTFLLILNDWSILCAVAGIRAYIYVYMTYFYQIKINSAYIWKHWITLFKVLVFLQLLSVFYAWYIYNFSISLGTGGYRMMGLFTNAGTLGAFCLGVSVLMSFIYLKKNCVSLIEYILVMSGAVILSIASGGRGAVIYSCVFLITSLICKLKLDESSKIISALSLLIVVIGTFFPLLIGYTGRGELMVSGAGRFEMWGILMNYSTLQLIFGQGLGVTTNTAVSMGVYPMSMDSTFTTIIMQFGIFAFLIFIFFLCKILLKILKDKQDWIFNLYFAFFLFVQLFSGNVLEMYAFSIPVVIVICEYIKKEDVGNASESDS